MKITKQQLKEGIILKEDDNIDIELADTTAEVADKLQDQAADSGVSLTDAEAADAANIAKEVGDKVEADEIVITPTKQTPLKIKNRLTEVLDEALRVSKYFNKNHINERANVLVCGLPGSSKTATVYNWAAGKVNICYVNAKNRDLDAFINGYPVQDPNEPLTVKQAVSGNLNDLDRPNSVLFIDELNRQTSQQIRGSLLSLINEHYVTGKEAGGRHYFKNFLFTIAAINPGGTMEDLGATKLNDAEKSRYLYTVNNFDSDPDTTKQYLNNKFIGLAKRLANMKDVDAEDVWDESPIAEVEIVDEPDTMTQQDRIEAFLRVAHLGDFIVSDLDFKYDDKSKLAALDREGRTMLNQRTLTAGLSANLGDVKKFRYWLENYSNFLDSDIEMIKSILDKYEFRIPTLQDLMKIYGLDPSTIKNEPKDEPVSVDIEPEEIEDDDDDDDDALEDDADFFTDPAGINSTLSPQAVTQAINDAILNF